MARLQLGRFALLTRLLGLRAPCHCVKKAKREIASGHGKTREVSPCSDCHGSRRGFRGTVLLQAVHQKHEPQGRDV
jgi:hypothetical protein